MRLFDRPMQPEELDKVHQLLMNYYNGLVESEVDKIIAEKKYTQADFDRILNKSQRTRR
ncbi:hypothetical protein [Spirosoma aerolatum]|uniref:hypothetical protein n=1 Tax=Spirosoma aerolatum TaxID=1211326 RepID=UPI0012D2C2A1|nr:hypothetical protein [Spirosoma aerolatum]